MESIPFDDISNVDRFLEYRYKKLNKHKNDVAFLLTRRDIDPRRNGLGKLLHLNL